MIVYDSFDEDCIQYAQGEVNNILLSIKKGLYQAFKTRLK